MVWSVQTEQLSCAKTSTISKQTETSFHLSLMTKEYLQLHPKWSLSQWHVWRKPCTNLAPTLTLFPNGLKWDSTGPTSPKSFIRCVQNDFKACGMFDANRSPILHQDEHYLQTGRNDHPLEPHHLGVPLGTSKGISEPIVRFAQTIRLSCNDTNTVSKWTVTRFHMTHIT
jgi:hypothetical protein